MFPPLSEIGRFALTYAALYSPSRAALVSQFSGRHPDGVVSSQAQSFRFGLIRRPAQNTR